MFRIAPHTRIALAAAAAAFLSAGLAAAGDLPAKKQTRAGLYVTALEAADMLHDDAVVFVDVRSRAEVAFVGMPTRVDVHIPLLTLAAGDSYDPGAGSYQLEPNPDFETDFLAFAMDNDIDADTPIIVMCRSGSRSAKAADRIAEMGFTHVYSMTDGFEGDTAKDGAQAGQRVVNGWRNAGLPWSYTVSATQAYHPAGY